MLKKATVTCYFALSITEGKRLYTGGPLKQVDADEAYLEAQSPIVRERMKRADVRLAAILNTLFSDVDVTALETLSLNDVVVANVAPPSIEQPTIAPVQPDTGVAVGAGDAEAG